MQKFIFVFIFSLILFVPCANAETFDIYSDNAILYNVDENKVMYEKDADKRVYIASLTKTLTALVVLDKIDDLDKEIDFSKVNYKFLSKKDLSISSYNIKKNYSYRDMLYSFILQSSADCGYALALSVSKDEDEFIRMMNFKAKQIGMNDSHFSNPVGYDDKGNYSTMRDVLTLMKHCMKNKELKKIMSTFSYTSADGETIYHTMHYYPKAYKLNMPYLKGGKTGTEDIPGYALMSYAYKNGSTYILVTTNADYSYDNPKHFRDAKKIYEYYFNNYGYQKIMKKGDVLVSLDTEYLKEDKINISTKDDVLYYLNNDYSNDDITFKYKGSKVVDPSVRKGNSLGYVQIYYKDKPIKRVPVVLDIDTHFDVYEFTFKNKYLIIAVLSYTLIMVGTYFIVRKIRTNKKLT